MKNRRLMTLLLLVSLALLSWMAKFYLGRDEFPYGAGPATQIVFQPENSVEGRSKTYVITDGDVFGEAALTVALTPEVGWSLVNVQRESIKSTFEERFVPYGGQVTSRFICPAQKYVKEHALNFNGKETKVILAVASERRIFGVCSIDQIKSVAAFWAAYDEKRKHVVTVKLFRLLSAPNEIEFAQQKVEEVLRNIVLPAK